MTPQSIAEAMNSSPEARRIYAGMLVARRKVSAMERDRKLTTARCAAIIEHQRAGNSVLQTALKCGVSKRSVYRVMAGEVR